MIEFFKYLYLVTLPVFLLYLNSLLFVFLAIKTKNKTHVVLMVYLLTISVVQTYSAWLAFSGTYNLHISHFYFVLQLIILGYFYYIICVLPIQKKIIKYSLVLCLIVLGIQYSIVPDMFYKFNNLEVFLTSYLLIIYALFHFYNLLTTKKSFLFFNTGVFLYLFGSTVLFLLVNLSLVIDINAINLNFNLRLYAVFQLLIFIEWIRLFFNKVTFIPKKVVHGI